MCDLDAVDGDEANRRMTLDDVNGVAILCRDILTASKERTVSPCDADYVVSSEEEVKERVVAFVRSRVINVV